MGISASIKSPASYTRSQMIICSTQRSSKHSPFACSLSMGTRHLSCRVYIKNHGNTKIAAKIFCDGRCNTVLTDTILNVSEKMIRSKVAYFPFLNNQLLHNNQNLPTVNCIQISSHFLKFMSSPKMYGSM